MLFRSARFGLILLLFAGGVCWFLWGVPADDSPKSIKLGDIRNGFQLTDRIFSGGQPSSDEDFRALHSAGIRTLLSVDGAAPDIERANSFGLRYVHLPSGYDGLEERTLLQVVKLAQVGEGRLFVHCHHGRHRGPAVAAVLCRSSAGWSQEQALEWLKTAGTSSNYPGLFRMVGSFRMPSEEALAGVSADFPARSEVNGLVEVMVALDRSLEHLDQIRSSGWRTPAEHPDLRPETEALLLEEHYREGQRLLDLSDRGAEFAEALRSAGSEAAVLREMMMDFQSSVSGQDSLHRVEVQFQTVKVTCARCHRSYRNGM